jgi:hypothetical protein
VSALRDISAEFPSLDRKNASGEGAAFTVSPSFGGRPRCHPFPLRFASVVPPGPFCYLNGVSEGHVRPSFTREPGHGQEIRQRAASADRDASRHALDGIRPAGGPDRGLLVLGQGVDRARGMASSRRAGGAGTRRRHDTPCLRGLIPEAGPNGLHSECFIRYFARQPEHTRAAINQDRARLAYRAQQ